MNAANLHIFNANIATNAVHLVDNVVTNLDIGKILQLLALIFTVHALALLHTINIIFR